MLGFSGVGRRAVGGGWCGGYEKKLLPVRDPEVTAWADDSASASVAIKS